MESQKKLADTWTQSLPKGTTKVDPSETLDKTLNFQRELINSVINAQQVAAHLTIETQKQLWDDYFQTTQKMAQQTKKLVSQSSSTLFVPVLLILQSLLSSACL